MSAAYTPGGAVARPIRRATQLLLPSTMPTKPLNLAVVLLASSLRSMLSDPHELQPSTANCSRVRMRRHRRHATSCLSDSGSCSCGMSSCMDAPSYDAIDENNINHLGP